MQQRRYRPGDVVDDYCPRERRITDHAIVAMIDDDIKQTRCVVCDAEHEYKDGKVPVQRRKKPQAALFAQVLDGLQGPQPAARLAPQSDLDSEPDAVMTDDAAAAIVNGARVAETDSEPAFVPPATPALGASSRLGATERVRVDAPGPSVVSDTFADEEPVARDDRPWRRQLIRAALPRPEGQQPQPTRQMPEFTIRQPNNRVHRHGRRRGGSGHQGNGNVQGPMRFGRDGQGQGGQRPHNGRRRRRGGKKQTS
jgi:hypothetical protein